jgi:hypothetical protein
LSVLAATAVKKERISRPVKARIGVIETTLTMYMKPKASTTNSMGYWATCPPNRNNVHNGEKIGYRAQSTLV